MPRLSEDEKLQIKNLVKMLPLRREVYVAHLTGNESFGEIPLAVLEQRSQGIKVHTISSEPASLNWTRSAIKNANLGRLWTGINRNPSESGFRVNMLLINGLGCEAALECLKVWVPFMLTDQPVWVHDADEAVESYPHIRKLGRSGRGMACLVTD